MTRNFDTRDGLRRVTEVTSGIPHMKSSVGASIFAILHDRCAGRILEVGFYHGVSTCYLAAVAEALDGHVTALDIPYSAALKPNAESLLTSCGLAHRVTLHRDSGGAAWSLAEAVRRGDTFDAVFLDDIHTWVQTGFHALLALRVLSPGGILILDDLDWTVSRSKSPHVRGLGMTDAQRDTKQVRMVWELLIQQDVRISRTWESMGMGFAELR